jgi:hypothetical protein
MTASWSTRRSAGVVRNGCQGSRAVNDLDGRRMASPGGLPTFVTIHVERLSRARGFFAGWLSANSSTRTGPIKHQLAAYPPRTSLGAPHQREGCRARMRQTTTAGVRHDEGKARSLMRNEAGIPGPRDPSLRAFCYRRPKTRQWRSRVPQSEQKFPKCELPHTSRPISERCCLRMGGSGTHLANAGFHVSFVCQRY